MAAIPSILKTRAMKAILKRTRNSEFRFNLVGANGEPIATGETYTKKAMAKKTLNKYFPEFHIIDKTKKK